MHHISFVPDATISLSGCLKRYHSFIGQNDFLTVNLLNLFILFIKYTRFVVMLRAKTYITAQRCLQLYLWVYDNYGLRVQ